PVLQAASSARAQHQRARRARRKPVVYLRKMANPRSPGGPGDSLPSAARPELDGLHTSTFDAGPLLIVPTRARLVVVSGPDAGKELLLERGTHYVGKSPPCSLILTDPRVSRKHLELEVLQRGVRVRDLDSKNGSYVEGARFHEITVGAGAVLVIGSTE